MLVKSIILACALPVVPQAVTNAIIMNETQWKPWSVSVNYPKRHPKIAQYVYKKWRDGHIESQQDALILSKAILAFDPSLSISVGLMQISSQHFKSRNIKLEDALDPCTNVKIGSELYMENYWSVLKKSNSKIEALLSAASIYNSGNTKLGWNNGYVDRFASYLPNNILDLLPASKNPIVNNTTAPKTSIQLPEHPDKPVHNEAKPIGQDDQSDSTRINMNISSQAEADTYINFKSLYDKTD